MLTFIIPVIVVQQLLRVFPELLMMFIYQVAFRHLTIPETTLHKK